MGRFLPLLFLLLFACRQKPAPADMLLQLKDLSELATVEYTVSKIIKASDDQQWYTVGDRKILLSCKARVKAGIDLSRLEVSDIRVDGKTIRLQLPAAQVLSVTVPPEEIRLEYEDVGLFRSDFSAAERQALLAQGEAQIRRQVAATTITRDAETQASLVLGNFFRGLGFETVQITFDSGTPTTTKPAL